MYKEGGKYVIHFVRYFLTRSSLPKGLLGRKGTKFLIINYIFVNPVILTKK